MTFHNYKRSYASNQNLFLVYYDSFYFIYIEKRP